MVGQWPTDWSILKPVLVTVPVFLWLLFGRVFSSLLFYGHLKTTCAKYLNNRAMMILIQIKLIERKVSFENGRNAVASRVGGVSW